MKLKITLEKITKILKETKERKNSNSKIETACAIESTLREFKVCVEACACDSTPNITNEIGNFGLHRGCRGCSRAISIKMIHLAAMINAAVFLLNVHRNVTYCIFMVISLSCAKCLSVLFADAQFSWM